MSVLVASAGYLGDKLTGDTIRFIFHTAAATGASTVLGGTPALSVYKDASDTQTTTGVTLEVDADGVVGMNRVTVALSDAFYTAGSDFNVVITTGTVGAVSVTGAPVAHFSIENRKVILADGKAHGGTLGSSTATLALKNVNVTSTTTTSAFRIENTHASGYGLHVINSAATGNPVATLFEAQGPATGGVAFGLTGNDTGLEIYGGAKGLVLDGDKGAQIYSGAGNTGSGNAINIECTDGHGISITSDGVSKHGIFVTGGNGGTSDGIKAVAGTGGVAFRQDILQQALTEAYAADNAAFTAAQALYMLWSAVAEIAISGTTMTCKKLDGSTTSMTFTLDSATAPTSRTRAT